MIINHNMGALNANRMMNINSSNASKSMQKLSSGLRINGASDDAAGLAISEKMRGQIRGLDQASANAQDGISLIQTAEGALNETHSILNRMRELTVQANNGTNKLEDTQKIQQEITQLQEEITSIGNKTQFNKQNLLDGTLGAKTAAVGSALVDGTGTLKIQDVTGAVVANGYTVTSNGTSLTLAKGDGSLSQTIAIADTTAVKVGDRYTFDKLGITLEAQNVNISGIATNNTFNVTASGVSFQVGANGSQTLALSIDDLRANQLGSGTIKMDAINVTDFVTVGHTFDDQLAAIDDAISKISEQRSNLGAKQNRLEHTIANLGTSSENLTAAESRIRDVDMAKEMSQFSKNNILSQAAQAMLAQANQQPQQVLQLLR